MEKLFRKKSVNAAIQDATAVGENEHSGLKRSLTVVDLTALGIAAVVGAGIFSTIGKASFEGGPGIVLFVSFHCFRLWLFSALLC